MAAAAHRASVNLQNARNSTGPRTAEGKQRVRLNALRHGAYSKTAILANEDPAAYEALGVRLIETFQPQNDEQLSVLRTIQDAQWRLDRVLSLEANLYAWGVRDNLQRARNFFPAEPPDSQTDLARADAYSDKARTFDQFHRQEARLRRILDRAFAAYAELVIQAADSSLPEAEPLSEAESEPATASNGFVSQIPAGMPHFTGPLAEIKRKQWIRRQTKSQSASAATE
jgi:hypothetical protein